MRALIVEDSSAWQQILTEILADAGLQVDVVDNLDAAVETLRAAPHRLAVVDLSLSGNDYQNQDGLDVLDAVRRFDPGCVTILLTGFATVELAVDALTEHNALSCLRKEAFNRAEFRELVKRALSSAPTSQAGTSHAASAPAVKAGATSVEPPAQGQVLVVEDDAGWRSILSELLADSGYEVHACASYGEALGLLRREKYALAVIDLSLDGSVTTGADLWNRGADEDELGGYRLLASVRAGGTPTIVVSGIATPERIERAYDEHAIFAFVEKQAFDRRAFLQIVEEARAAAAATGELDVLTAREREVVELLAQGMTNKEIAAELFITTNTVKRHLKSIFEKLDVHTRSAAAAKAVGAGVSVD
ncbi:MAG: response regulator [Anaerolineae bacterium]|nr:response regulator [Anaerolineae bacterium]